MRIGLSSWSYSWNIGVAGYDQPAHPFGWREMLQKAKELNADTLQIADNAPLDRMDDLDLLGKAAAASGITLETGTRGVRPENLSRYLDITQQLGGTLLRTLLHDGSDVPDPDTACARIREIAPELNKRGISLAIENHDLYPARVLREIIERAGCSRVGACLDAVNNFAQGESVREVIQILGPVALCFHCKDFRVRRVSSGMGFELYGCPTGDGLLRLTDCLSLLPAREISFIAELWTPWQGDISATCALETAWAERSMRYLSKLQKEHGHA